MMLVCSYSASKNEVFFNFSDEIELQDYKAPHHAQPEVHNGYMPVSQVPVYVDAQGNVVQH